MRNIQIFPNALNSRYIRNWNLNVINTIQIFLLRISKVLSKYYLCKQENPFRKRICKAFSSNAGFGGPIVGNDGGEIQMTFDQFVLMYSVFSDRAPREMKIHYAFLIYGKNDNLLFVYKPHSI